MEHLNVSEYSEFLHQNALSLIMYFYISLFDLGELHFHSPFDVDVRYFILHLRQLSHLYVSFLEFCFIF